jgi:hypothetical protein
MKDNECEPGIPIAPVRLSLTLFALVMFGSGAGLAATAGWFVVEDMSNHSCERTTTRPPESPGLKVYEFDTFRQAGMWIWEHHSKCQESSALH